MSLSKALMYKGGDSKKPRILLLAPTRVAAVHINGTTIHCGLQINIGGKMFPLNDRHRAILRNKLSEVRLIITDEKDKRLNERFGYSDQLPFAGLSVIVVVIFISYLQPEVYQYILVVRGQ